MLGKTRGEKPVFFLSFIETFLHPVCTKCSNRPIKLLNSWADWCIRGRTFSLPPQLKHPLLCGRSLCCHVYWYRVCVCVCVSKHSDRSRLSGFLSADDVYVFLPFISEEVLDSQTRLISVVEWNVCEQNQRTTAFVEHMFRLQCFTYRYCLVYKK